MNLNNIVIVLDHPDESRNIGAACRAMANNDISELRIVGKKEDYDIEHIHVLAIHAGGIFDKANFYNSITEATADCSICAGTTRRRGKKRGKLLLPEEFADMADDITGAPVVSIRPDGHSTTADTHNNCKTTGDTCDGHSTTGDTHNNCKTTGDTCDGQSTTEAGIGGKVAVIFGNERTGLTDEQLDQCNLGVTIPSSDNFGSLNLSHAVQIMSYHLYRRALLQKKGEYRGYTPLTLERVDRTVQTITDNMQKIGFFKMPGREDMENFWRSILSRASLSEGEAQYLEKTFSKMAGLAGKNTGK